MTVAETEAEERSAFYKNRPVRVLGESPDGKLACIQYADTEDEHEHVPARDVTDVRFPDVKIRLTGFDGNGAYIIGRMIRALERAGHADVVDQFTSEATSGDYNHLLATCMSWADVS